MAGKNINDIEQQRLKLQNICEALIKKIGPIQIGSEEQFPYRWRKAAKGRTVWRIVEEAITQNLELSHDEFNMKEVSPSPGEVTVYDLKCILDSDDDPIFINIKTAVVGGRRNKDDISKAEGLMDFYKQNSTRTFFIATFFIEFKQNMTIEINKVVVFPIAWIKDIYVNPSNNGNLQSAYYKDLNQAVRRTNEEFIPLLLNAVERAKAKRLKNGL